MFKVAEIFYGENLENETSLKVDQNSTKNLGYGSRRGDSKTEITSGDRNMQKDPYGIFEAG